MKHTSINNTPSNQGEGIMQYTVYYETDDRKIVFARIPGNSIVDMYNKLLQVPSFKRIRKVTGTSEYYEQF